MTVRRLARGAVGALLAVFAGACLVGCREGSLAEVAALPRSGVGSHSASALGRRALRVTVPLGAEVHLSLSSAVASATSRVGDTVTGTTTAAVLVGGCVAIPPGSTVHGRVTGVGPATKGDAVALTFTSLTTPGGASATMSASLTSAAETTGKNVVITLDAPLTIARRS